MSRKYLRIEIESKGIMIDLKYVKPEDIKFQLGNLEKDNFISEKQLTLKELHEGGFE